MKTSRTPLEFSRIAHWACAALLIAGAAAAQDVTTVVDRWAGGAELGLNAARGNSRYTMLTSGLRFTHLNKQLFELDWATNITYGESDLTVIARRIFTALKADLHPVATWSPFVFSTLESDRIRKLNLFANTGAGIKYTFHRTDSSSLSVSLAGLYSYKSIIGAGNTTVARLSLRPKVSRKFASGFSFEQVTFWQPAAADFPDYNIESNTRLNFAVSKTRTLFANHLYRFDSRPPLGVKREDQLFVAGFRLQF